MKRLMSLLLMFCLLIPCLAAPALADTPKPIPTIDYDSIPEPREGLHHYLLLCSDQWTNKLVNTDGIVIVTLDTVTHRIMLTSIIRDALVERPDGVIGRINYIARNSGPEALCKVISQHLGIKIEKYILLNFQMIANIIDYLGGVDITVNASEAAYLRRYPLDPGQTEPTMAQAGTYRFTGARQSFTCASARRAAAAISCAHSAPARSCPPWQTSAAPLPTIRRATLWTSS